MRGKKKTSLVMAVDGSFLGPKGNAQLSAQGPQQKSLIAAAAANQKAPHIWGHHQQELSHPVPKVEKGKGSAPSVLGR